MRRKLTDAQISAALIRLRSRGASTTWRALHTELHRQFGFAGRTDRLRAASRRLNEYPTSQTSGQLAPSDSGSGAELPEMRRQLSEALQERDRALERAARAEEREIRHQDRWADEVHQLRQAVAQLRDAQAHRQQLENQVRSLQQELRALYAQLGPRR